MGGVDLQRFKFNKTPTRSYRDLVKEILETPDSVPFKYEDVLCKRRLFATSSLSNASVRQSIYEASLEQISLENREKIKLATDQYGRVILYTDAQKSTYYFEYDDFGRLTSVRGWDQPISYQYSYDSGKISFSYELLSGTNEYIKRFSYAGNSDQVSQLQIYKNEELEHSFSVRIDGDDVILERECQ